MWRAIRIVMMCLLAVAVPMQGYAAAAMLHCAPAHKHEHKHQHPTAGHEAHEAHERHAQASGDVHDASDIKCSACASCCTGAPLPAAALPPLSSPAAHELAAAPTPLIAPFLTGGLERPPRPSLA
jgi:hypothetical protein